MFPQIPRCIQCAILAVLLAAPAATADLPDEAGFESVGEFPWEGWYGPLADGLLGLRFGTGGFEVNAVMRDRGLEPSNARPHTLRFEGDILGAPAELVAEFTGDRPSDPDAQLRVVQIRWIVRGLPQPGKRRFDQLDDMLSGRYGRPVQESDDGMAALENGRGSVSRLYYGPEARAWLQLRAEGRELHSLLIRIECPQLPRAEED